jgi:2'-5' RNA ligase
MDTGNFSDLREHELESFRNIRLLHNHWSRPSAPRSYYWYLTFENYPELHSLATECQQAIAFPYYDLTPPRDLHLTLDRIAFHSDMTPDRLERIEAAATGACAEMARFNVCIGFLGGTPGAIGFTTHPAQPTQELRNTLRRVTLSVYPDAPVGRSEFHPHVAIAYANSDGIPAAEAIAAAEKLNSKPPVNVTITGVTLVLLERRPRSYAWRTISRIPLGG